MRGVDVFDQYASYYKFDHRALKWYMKIAFSMIEVAFLNSKVIYDKF